MKKILIVEDDEVCANELKELLNSSGYEATIFDDYFHPVESILKIAPNLILLDINIPGMNGEVLLKKIKSEIDIPIIMVTSKNDDADEVLSMSYGAEDYITKPYNPNILLLRVAAVLKRTSILKTPTYKDLEIDLQKGILKKGASEVILTKNEMIIFGYLLNNQNRIVARDELMTMLWDNDEYINDNALTVNVSRLRGKLKELGLSDAIETRKGIGYILS